MSATATKSVLFLRIWFQDGGKTSFKNFSKDNHLPKWKIIDRMINGILNKKYSGKFKSAIFYDTKTNAEIHKILNKYEPRIFLTINLKNGKTCYYKNLEAEDSLSNDKIIENMTNRLLKNKYINQYVTAIFFDENKNELQKLINGNEIKDTAPDSYPLMYLRIWFQNGGKTSFPNITELNKFGYQYNIEKLGVMLNNKYYGKYSTAIIYNNTTGEPLAKWVYGERKF